MTQRLKKKPKYLDYIVLDSSNNRKQLSSGLGYLEALTEDNVELIEIPIERFTEDRIIVGGHKRQVHAVFCATGTNIDTVPTFSIQANGLDLCEAWRTRWQDWCSKTYLGLATPNFRTFSSLLILMEPVQVVLYHIVSRFS